MRPYISAFAGGRMPRLSGVIISVAVSAFLAACASSDGGSGGGGGFAGLFGGGKPSADATKAGTTASPTAANPTTGGTAANAGVTVVQTQSYDPSYFLKSGYCPPVQVLPGTEAMIVYDHGHDGDSAFVRTQGSVTDTARECHALDASTLSIKVGVSGRILAGPKGGAGTVTMPLRIAVARQHDNSVLFSKAFPVSVTLAAPELAANYSEVFDQVVVKVAPDDRDLIVYVGFDEGKPKPKAGT